LISVQAHQNSTRLPQAYQFNYLAWIDVVAQVT